MTLKDLKNQIENKNIELKFSIYKYTDNLFLPFHYIKEIKKVLNCEIEFIENLNSYLNRSKDIFTIQDKSDENLLNIFIVDNFEECKKELIKANNLIIICKTMSSEVEEFFTPYITVFPKLEKWQIKEYVYSYGEGIDSKKLDSLIELCKWDIYRIENELSKIKIFSVNERKYKFNEFIENGIFNDLSNHNIFDFSNAILKKDINSLSALYTEIEKIDCEPLGLVTILYNNLKTIISIQLDPSITAEKLGIPSNRFWSIKKNNCGYYTKTQLIKSFELITSIDKKLKTGEITSDIIVDYIVCHMLSF